MAFIRKRHSSNHRLYGDIYSYQLIETYRENGKVKQRVICNLHGCETVEQALEIAKEHLEDYRKTVARGVPAYDWPQTWSWRRLSTAEQELEKTRWREHMASEVASYEARVALLERVVSESGLV
jgi:hypothetical protein